MEALYLKPWRHKGREGPRNIPVMVEIVSTPYWARVYGLMDEVGRLQLMVNIKLGDKLVALPYLSDLLRFEKCHDIPKKPLKLKNAEIELYPR